MSHTPVAATTPILSARPGPAITNTYMRFIHSFGLSCESGDLGLFGCELADLLSVEDAGVELFAPIL